MLPLHCQLTRITNQTDVHGGGFFGVKKERKQENEKDDEEDGRDHRTQLERGKLSDDENHRPRNPLTLILKTTT